MSKLFFVIERFKNEDAAPVYRRLRAKGRMAPAGVVYVSSWVDTSLTRCFQLMQADDRRHLDAWMAQWEDLVDFEVVPVLTSAEAADRIAGASDS